MEIKEAAMAIVKKIPEEYQLAKAKVEALTPQDRLVYDYLMSGRKLTGLAAFTTLGVASLTSRIATLRRLGMTINDEWAHDHFERRYKAYWVPSGEDA